MLSLCLVLWREGLVVEKFHSSDRCRAALSAEVRRAEAMRESWANRRAGEA